MNTEEYKRASGAFNTKSINRDIRLAKLILRFIEIVSPGGNAIDKFYLARELKLDGPIEDIEGTLSKLKDKDKESITDASLTYLAAVKSSDGNGDATRIIRDLKKFVIKDDERRSYFVDVTDEKIDLIIDAFKEKPIRSSNDLKQLVDSSPELKKTIDGFVTSVRRICHKGEKDANRKIALSELNEILERLLELKADDFKELTEDELFDAKESLKDINDALFRLKQEINK